MKIFPWVLNLFSLTTAFCLSNGKVTTGRYMGVVAAIGWSTYGLLIHEYSFLFANIIFVYIYASAIIKFNSKRDEYKETFEEQKEVIENLNKNLNERIKKEDKILNLKKEKIRKIANIAKENLKNIEDLANSID